MEQLTSPIIENDQYLHHHHHQWSSLNNEIFKANHHHEEASTFMAQLFNSTTLDHHHHDPNFNIMAALDHNQAPNFELITSSNSSFYNMLSQESGENNFCDSMNFCLGNQLGNCNNNGDGFNIEDHEDPMNLQACFEAEFIKLPQDQENIDHNKIEIICKKRSRGFGDKRSKKTMKITSSSNIQEDGNDAGHSRQSTSAYCSEDDLYAYPELNGGANNFGLSLKDPIKSRASRGSATDPQSMYARKRRERINERLKILQNLIPNGTKVDLSTMLEEAVEYVKFLQLQIKLLSSDDLWMYAPIAYNGMDIGLNTSKES